MAKIQIKSEKLTPFGGIFPVMEKFEQAVCPIIDQTLGKRGSSLSYSYGEIFRTLMSVYFCGGSHIEDISNHLLPHLKLHPTLKSCSSDTILRAIQELTIGNTTYNSDSGKSYDFNTADKINSLLLDALLFSGQLDTDKEYVLDFDHEFLETEKHDAKQTYKHFRGYSPGVAVIDDTVVGIENRDGNANVRFRQQDTLERFFTRFESRGIHIKRARMDCGSCSKEIVQTIAKHADYYYIRANRCSSLYNDIFAMTGWQKAEIGGIEYELNSVKIMKWEGVPCRLIIQRQKRIGGELDIWEGEYTYRCIMTNDFEMTPLDIVLFYNQRGSKERIFDDLNNGFGWSHLPKSFMSENTVFLIMTALIRNFYKLLMNDDGIKKFGLKQTSRIKSFVFKLVSVPAKWIRTSRQHVLNIYTNQPAYTTIFKSDFG